MGRFGYILAGMLLFAAAAGVLGYRLVNEPSLLGRYSWLVGGENAASPGSEATRSLRPQSAPDGDAFTTARREDRRSPREQLNNMKLLELGLDVANVLVGIIGIWLTVSGMRMRRRAAA